MKGSNKGTTETDDRITEAQYKGCLKGGRAGKNKKKKQKKGKGGQALGYKQKKQKKGSQTGRSKTLSKKTIKQMEEAFRSGISPRQAPTCTDEHCDAVVTWDSSARKKKGVPLGNWRTKCVSAILCKKCLHF